MESGLYIIVYEVGDIYHLELARDTESDNGILFNSETEAQIWAEENCAWGFRIFEW